MAMEVAGPVRGTYNAEGRFFAVAGNTLFQITAAGVSVPLGTVPGVGRVSFSHNQITNGNEILVNNGASGYIYNTVTQVFQRITDTSYPGGLRAVFINNRFVQIEPARRYLFNSALADGLSYTALDRFTSETSPDLAMSIESIGNQLAVFSSTTTEWFEDTGANPQPFRSTGIVADKGAAGPFSTAKMDNQLFMLADDGVFYRYQGYNPVRISTKPIEQAIRNKNWFNVFTTVWEDSGYAVCYWTFPDGHTWGYDASSGKWHRRESYGFNRWRLNSLTYWQNAWYGGDFQNGRLWQLDWDYLLEGDKEFESIRAAGVISDNQNRVIHERLEVIMDTGMVKTVPVEFVEQPEGPSITGSAPDGFTGDPYSFSYTTTPGDSPIARTVIRDETTVLVDGEPSTLAAAGFTWNQSTATISSANVASNVVVSLSLRVYDTAGLYADHTDEFIVVQEIALLVTGSEKTLSGPLFARASALSDLTFEGILTSTGADISDATATFADELFVAVSSAGARYAADSSGSWTSGTVGSFPGGSPNFGKIVGSPSGYLSVIPEDSSNPTAFIAPSPPTAFTRTTLLATNTEGNPTTDVQKANNVLFVNDWYVLCYSRSFFQSSVPEGPYVAVWDEFKEIDSGRNPNAESIVAWYDFAFFNDAWYAIISWDFELSTRKTQLIRSENGITDWSVFTVLVDIGYADAEAPIQLCAGGDRLVCYNSGGTLRTDADDFATVIETGLSGPGINHLRDGRKIVYTGALFYCIGSSDTCVTFNPITLEVGELTTMPINSAVSISCNFVESP